MSSGFVSVLTSLILTLVVAFLERLAKKGDRFGLLLNFQAYRRYRKQSCIRKDATVRPTLGECLRQLGQ